MINMCRAVEVDNTGLGAALGRLGRVVSNGGLSATLKVPFGETTRIASALIASFPVQDFTVEEVPLEDVLSQVFADIP
ncbi:MAG: hypothetical protein HPY52_00325 [Firmicutes bacterium]|nr:hypothetical protein [Bacillota bacterium]